MKRQVNKKIFVFAFSLLFGMQTDAATYAQTYRVDVPNAEEKSDNRFMSGNFENIYRYEMLVFEGEEMSEAAQKTLEAAMQKMQTLQKNGKDVSLTLTAHTQSTTDDANEKTIESSAYAQSLINIAKKELTQTQSDALSQKYLQVVEQKLAENAIKKEHVFSEVRGGRDAIYTEVYASDKEKAHGVFVALYVNKIEKTKETVKPKVQKAPVVTAPLVLDSDKDGVPDDKDKCKNTPQGVSVDINGCPLKSTLKLNFATDSDIILENSYAEIERFAAFLKANTAYHTLITGHTDSVGKDVYNMGLSQRRALSTKNALVKAGVDASRLSAKGRGELDPIESNMLAEGRAKNRRIEVELFLQK